MSSLRAALEQNAARLKADPKANNIYSNTLSDVRFAALRAQPDFSKMMESLKPK